MKLLSLSSGLNLRRAGESPEIKKHPPVYGCEMSVGKTPKFKQRGYYSMINRKVLSRTVLSAVLLLIHSLLSAIIWEIKQDGTGDFFHIQEGINAAAEGDTVLVYPGIYYENIDFSGKDIVVSSLQLINGDMSYIQSTIIDGSYSGNVVKIISNESENTLLNGFTIRNGVAQYGAGVCVLYSSPTLRNLLVTNNKSSGIAFGNSGSFVENVSIMGNHSFSMGGGITISGNSNLTFSSEKKCNIYNNTAGSDAEISIHPYQTTPVHVIVDTFTVFDSGWSFVTQSPYLELSIDKQWLQQIESDLYVSPYGDDNNSGLTAADPLRSIQWALTQIKADSLNHRTIHLAPGTYSPAANDQLFPLNMRSYVTLKGAGKDHTFLEEPIGSTPTRPSAVIFAIGVTDITIRDLTIRNINNDGMDHIDAITMREHLAPGVKINVEFSGFRMTDCYRAVFGFSSNGNLRIEDSEFINNAGRLLRIYSRGNNPDEYGDVYLNNLIIMGNQPTVEYGEGYSPNLVIQRFKNIHISNCLVVNNIHHSTWAPTAYVRLIPYNNLTFSNNIIAYNQTMGDVPGGAFALEGPGTFDIKNSIIYGNEQYEFITYKNSIRPATVNISHSLIEGGTNPSIIHVADPNPHGVNIYWGEGIIDSPPLFLGEVEDGYDLSDMLFFQFSPFSPGIDAGTPDISGLNLPPYDLLFNKRIWDGLGDGEAVIDIGCFEYNAPEYLNIEDYPVVQHSGLQLRNYPNPFNPETTILFSLPHPGDIRFDIFNVRSQRIITLIEEYRDPGEHRVIWNGRDERGNRVSSGIYFYRLKAGKLTEQKKMILLK